MPHFAFGRLRSILDLGKKLGLDPDAAMGNALAVRLRLTDQRGEARAEKLGALAIEAEIYLSGID
jgi:hypothetical protein